VKVKAVPNRKDTTSFSQTSLLLNTTNSLLKDGGNLGGRRFGFCSVGTNLLGGTSQETRTSRADLSSK
jgi:hypothetical protein